MSVDDKFPTLAAGTSMASCCRSSWLIPVVNLPVFRVQLADEAPRQHGRMCRTTEASCTPRMRSCPRLQAAPLLGAALSCRLPPTLTGGLPTDWGGQSRGVAGGGGRRSCSRPWRRRWQHWRPTTPPRAPQACPPSPPAFPWPRLAGLAPPHHPLSWHPSLTYAPRRSLASPRPSPSNPCRD